MSTTSDHVRPFTKSNVLEPKLSTQDLTNLLAILPKLSEKEQVLLLKELATFEKRQFS